MPEVIISAFAENRLVPITKLAIKLRVVVFILFRFLFTETKLVGINKVVTCFYC